MIGRRRLRRQLLQIQHSSKDWNIGRRSMIMPFRTQNLTKHLIRENQRQIIGRIKSIVPKILCGLFELSIIEQLYTDAVRCRSQLQPGYFLFQLLELFLFLERHFPLVIQAHAGGLFLFWLCGTPCSSSIPLAEELPFSELTFHIYTTMMHFHKFFSH